MNDFFYQNKQAKKRRVTFVATLIILCLITSSVSGAVSSFTVYNYLTAKSTSNEAAETTTVQEAENSFIVEENTTQEETEIHIIFPEETTVLNTSGELSTNNPENTNSQEYTSIQESTQQVENISEETSVNEPATVPAETTTVEAKKTKGEIYAEAVGSVVCITVTGYETYTSFFGQSFSKKFTSSGSGFIVSSDGYIVTNYHVVENSDLISVSTYDGTSYEATLRGYEEANDIAVLKINGSFTPVRLGNSSELLVGDDIMVIGNALGELAYTFTDGVVSYLSRKITTDTGTSINMFQTNAAINEGNSGGPVYNMDGEVVGIASAKYASSSIEGLGFCIPIDDVKTIIDDLINLGYVSGKPLLGISVQTITSAMAIKYSYPTGCYIVALDENSCAYSAGLEATDVITYLDGERISSVDELSAFLASKKAGDTLEITYVRQSQSYTVSLVLDEYTPATARTSYSNVYDF